MRTSWNRLVGPASAFALVASSLLLIPSSASGNPAGTGLVINEVYGGGGNNQATWTNDFIEIYNPTGSAIALGGKSLQYRAAATTTTATNVFALPAFSLGAGKHYLVQCAGGATGAALPQAADTTACGLNLSGTAGQVFLVNGTAGIDPDGAGNAAVTDANVIDFVGFGTAAIREGTAAAPAPSNSSSITRTNGVDTDRNNVDFTVLNGTAMTPTNSTGGAPTPLAAVDPADVDAFVNTPISNITLQATGGTPAYSWSFSTLPAGLEETSDGVIAGTPTEVGTTTVTATVTDSAAPTPATSTVEFEIDVQAAPQRLTIAEIQGTGPTTPESGKTVITEGVVTAAYPNGDGNYAGFYLQTGGQEGVDYDTAGASDAIFVFSGSKTLPAIGSTVEVQGVAGERFGSTQLNSSSAANPITVLGTPQPAVVPGDVVPGTDCVLPGSNCLAGAALDAAREEHEGELFQPTGDYTVTDSYDGSPFTQSGSRGFAMQGEIGLAAESDVPLMIPTESIDQSDASGLAARQRYNLAHQLILDDGADIDYSTNTFEDLQFPWLTPSHPVRVGASVTFPKPVVLRFDFDFWRLQPQTKVAPGQDGQDRVAIENTRTSAPEDVLGSTGDLKIATFNMLNYFNTLGEEWAASDGNSTGSDTSAFSLTNPRRCSFYTDRGPVGGGTAARISNDTCIQDAIDPITGLKVQLLGPRGAANQTNFLNQEAKELEAINTIDADVMSLEEVENSIKLYDPAIDGPNGTDKDRDDALKRLVLKLNQHWATHHPSYVGDRWAYVASPRPEALPTVTEQDAIRSAFIYNPSKVETVGRSQVLLNAPQFRNAREPLAQAFKPLGGGREDAFVVIVNHFKSKSGPQAPATVNGDNVDAGDGAGFYNGDRKRQAAALVAFAEQVSSDKNIEPVFFTGDFNSYSAEDPVQVIEAAGYENLKPSTPETTYSFGGLAGSLDHVFANPAALDMVTGEDIWEINAGESVYYEYSRLNANATNLYAVNPFRSSDHNPEIIGIDVGELTADPTVDTVQILATNDFHGRLVDDPGSAAAGAASMAGAVKELRAENPDTIFAAAGDLIGASTFESFLQNDEPTIAALNEAGLEVSSVGNHEFDKGYHDLVDRVMPLTSWEYLGANVEFKDTEDGHAAGDPALPETWCETLPNGRVVGFVGAVTEDLETLVSASAIEDIVVTSIVDAVNEHADDLKGPDGCDTGVSADLVIELVHEGAASTSYAAVTDDSTFGKIVAGANENVDAIVSGHTHLAYNHKVPVQAWIDENRDVTERPVVSAGQYGANLNRLQFEFAPGDGDLVNIRQTVLQLKDYDADPATQDIVDDAVAYAEVAGAAVLGDVEGPFMRARRTDPNISGGPAVENRGGESTVGNLIAEIQRWKTGADIGFMNPGGLRADLLGNDGTPRPVTYRQAADVQPFANTLVSMDLTGDQIKTILEQQWQRDADGNVPSRPFLRLGTSDGFTFTQDASRAEGDRITGMWLDGQPLDPDATYRVSATSFLSSGTGDNFWGFAAATNKQDTGKTDLQAVVDYMAEFADPLAVDYAQHGVGVHFAGGAPAEYGAGDTLAFTLSSLAMTAAGDVQDAQVEVLLGDTVLGTFPVTNTLRTEPDDEAGTAAVSVVLPEGLADGSANVLVRGTTTGTEVIVPITTTDGLPNSTVSADDASMAYGQTGSVDVTVTPSSATGTVTVRDGITVLGSATLAGGAATVTIPAGSLEVGDHELTLVYGGDSATTGSLGSVTMTVTKAEPTLTATATPASVEIDQTSSIAVTVAAAGVSPTGTVMASVDGSVIDTATLVDGAATLTVGPFPTAGNQTVTIDYSGDAQTGSGSTTTTVAVTPQNPVGSTTTAAASPMAYGTPGTVSVAVTSTRANKAGSVQLLEGSTLIATGSVAADGTGTLTIPGTMLAVGTHSLTVKYLGNSGTQPSQGTVSVTVSKADSTTQVAVVPTQVVVGKSGVSAQVSVTAAGFTPTGYVFVSVNGVPVGVGLLVNGTASVAIPPIPFAGVRSVTASYVGDATTRPSQSAPATLTVLKRSSSVTADSTPQSVKVNKTEVKLRVEVDADGATPTGLVKITVPGQGTQWESLDKGKATFRLDPFRSTGVQVVTVTYQGDSWTEGSTTTHAIDVRR
ncbi:ExeM/NucH family extracellular endonuclease [Nocardioides caricicola]|uniref:ExeM/NucH family extracellular endonuclease n=1 Tax=Nocardioides caricicola TaxID=634770 RepID=A0ABW0N916_9ACTN